MSLLALVDYGLGNLRSICAALDRLDIGFCCTADPFLISEANGLVLPGVGAFPDGMRNLRELGLLTLLDEMVLDRKVPVLGICLGFELMAKEGTEFGLTPGLGWIDAKIIRMEPISSQIRVPHVGWNDCVRERESPIFNEIPDDALFYFTHSYHMECKESKDIVARSEHGESFVAAIHKGNIFGTQFHPEKSQYHGLKLLKNFSEIAHATC